jgi:PKD repeat protein
VVLASTSTDSDSAITGFSWDLSGSGMFGPGGSAFTTTFASPGAHVVRLRVTDARGQTDVASQTIAVSAAVPKLMQPFPVVRIADTVSSLRVKVSLLTVQAPVGSTVTVTCDGPGCPRQSQDSVATSKRTPNRMGGVVLIVFRRFERALRYGASLQVRVFAPGQIGKYTRFDVRRGKLPVRLDTCLGATGSAPIVCPLS